MAAADAIKVNENTVAEVAYAQAMVDMAFNFGSVGNYLDQAEQLADKAVADKGSAGVTKLTAGLLLAEIPLARLWLSSGSCDQSAVNSQTQIATGSLTEAGSYRENLPASWNKGRRRVQRNAIAAASYPVAVLVTLRRWAAANNIGEEWLPLLAPISRSVRLELKDKNKLPIWDVGIFAKDRSLSLKDPVHRLRVESSGKKLSPDLARQGIAAVAIADLNPVFNSTNKADELTPYEITQRIISDLLVEESHPAYKAASARLEGAAEVVLGKIDRVM